MREAGLQDLKTRTKAFAPRIIKVYTALPKSPEAQVLGKQVLRCGTSAGAHYHEACRAKSDADFISKIEGALQELEEAIYWLDLISEAQLFKVERLQPLQDEIQELIAMFVSMVKNVKNKGRRTG